MFREKHANRQNGLNIFLTGLIIAAAAQIIKRFTLTIDFSLDFVSFIGVLLALWGIFKIISQNAERLFKRFILVCICVGLVSFVAVESLIVGEKGDGGSAPEMSYAVVLGAGLYGETPSMILISRLQEALEYLEKYPDSKAILSGGQGPGESVTEAWAMKKWLMQRGIDPSRLIEEGESRNTDENFRNSARLLARLGVVNARVAVITSEFHLYRSLKLAEKYGIEAVGIGAATPDYGLLKQNSYFREYFSVMLFYFKSFAEEKNFS